MKRILATAAIVALSAGAGMADGTKHSKDTKGAHAAGGGGVIRAECSPEIWASVNLLDRPTEAFVQQIRAAIGPRATRGEAYILGEAYCRHPERLRRTGVAEAALQRDIVGMRQR